MTSEINNRNNQKHLSPQKFFSIEANSDVLRYFDTQEQMNKVASQFMIDCISDVLSKRGECFVALAGGKTPVTCYQNFAMRLQKSIATFPKGTIHFFLGDERIVPSDASDSNTKMIRHNLMSHMPDVNAIFHAPETSLPDSSHVAADYEYQIKKVLPVKDGSPVFDLVILGLGTDGHTASIFSDTLGDHQKKEWVLPVSKGPNRIHERITLSISVINSAYQVMFLISGIEKHPVLYQVLSRNSAYPASQIMPDHDRVLYFVSN